MRIPKKAIPLFEQFAKINKKDVFAVLGNHNQYLLEDIEDRLDVIKDDPIMAAQNPLTPERVLAVATILFMFGVNPTNGFHWDKAEIERLELTTLPAARFKTEYMGNVYSGIVAGLTRLTGTVWFGGWRVTMFPKFITPPFHQYGRI